MSCKLNWIKTEYFRVRNESNHAADTTLRHQFSSLLIKSRTHVVIDEVLQKRSPGWSKTLIFDEPEIQPNCSNRTRLCRVKELRFKSDVR